MKQVLHFYISKDDTQYTAECMELSIVTQGYTLDELLANVKEATSLHLEIEPLEDVGVVLSPIISVNYEFMQTV